MTTPAFRTQALPAPAAEAERRALIQALLGLTPRRPVRRTVRPPWWWQRLLLGRHACQSLRILHRQQ